MKKIFPTELIEFLQCRHMAKLRLLGVRPDSFISEEISLLREKGIEHEKNFLSTLEGNVVCIDSELPIDEQQEQTQAAMKNGADWIYQAYLQNKDCAGYADFLEKKEGQSSLGNHYYEVIDTKLSNRPTPANAIQLIHYSELVSNFQEKNAQSFHVIHGDNSKTTLKKEDIIHYYHELLEDYRKFVNGNEFTEPFPISACKQCGYQNHCQKYLQEKEHLALIPGLNINQMEVLRKESIRTVKDLHLSENKPAAMTQTVFTDVKKTAVAVLNNSLLLKSPDNLATLKKNIKDSLFFAIYKTIQNQSGALTFFMGVMTENGRYESVIHHDSQEEKKSLERMVSFISRYLNRYPNTKLFVFGNEDARLLHDLSNRYNICHDELDEIMIKKKIISSRNLLKQTFIFPSTDVSTSSLIKEICPEQETHPVIEKSPQLLYELFQSLGLEDRLGAIKKRAEEELKLHIQCLKELSSFNESDFPLTLNRVELCE